MALISLAVAVGALAYNTWRNETTEEQRNVRHAGPAQQAGQDLTSSIERARQAVLGVLKKLD